MDAITDLDLLIQTLDEIGIPYSKSKQGNEVEIKIEKGFLGSDDYNTMIFVFMDPDAEDTLYTDPGEFIR